MGSHPGWSALQSGCDSEAELLKFKITYQDPKTDEEVVEEKEFETTMAEQGTTITALEWAEDYAYTMADKGHFTIEEVPTLGY